MIEQRASSRARCVLIALVLVLAGCGGGDDSTEPVDVDDPAATTAGDEQQLIAYQTFAGSGDGVWLINRDGSGKRLVSVNAVLPDWSSDGERVVYSGRGGETEPLYVYAFAAVRFLFGR